MNHFVYNGTSSRKYRAYISGSGVFRSPEPDYQSIEVPGRNGDLIYANRRMKNVEIEYPAFITENFRENFRELRGWLLADHGYHRLEDSYNPDEFRLAMFTQTLDPTVMDKQNAGKFTITFSCKPQRFLKDGEISRVYTKPMTLLNRTRFPAKPLLRCYGAGAFTVGNTTVTVKEHSLPFIDIDCDMMDCFCGNVNANQFVTLTAFPELPAGETLVDPGKLTKIEVSPRWWTV